MIEFMPSRKPFEDLAENQLRTPSRSSRIVRAAVFIRGTFECMIQEIARRINKNIDEIDGYRTVQVFIQGAEHLPPAPAQVKSQMMYFVYNYRTTTYQDLYEKLAVTHLTFERIHPFADGNGRTGRVLLSYELLRNDQLPLVIPQNSRTDYFRLLADQDAPGLADFLRQCHQAELERARAFGFEAGSGPNA